MGAFNLCVHGEPVGMAWLVWGCLGAWTGGGENYYNRRFPGYRFLPSAAGVGAQSLMTNPAPPLFTDNDMSTRRLHGIFLYVHEVRPPEHCAQARIRACGICGADAGLEI